MGWEDKHLHQFIKNDKYYAENVEDDFFQFGSDKNVDYNEMKISDLLTKEKEKIIYEYDFGDGWEHEIILEKILPADKTFKNPLCTDGKMSCPPEDCGGVWGYAAMLDILSQPDREEYENYLEWLGEEFDPEHFDINLINKKLMKMDFGPHGL